MSPDKTISEKTRLERRRPRVVWLPLLAVLLLVGCRQDMHDQAKHEPFEHSALFADGAAVRVPPAHTVPRGVLDRGDEFATGTDENGAFLTELPMPLTRELLDRGERGFNTYCAPCHDRTGSGRGMIVLRGFAQPPSYHEPRLLAMPVGYFYDVDTNGFGQMSGYRSQISTEDRWAIAAWVRVLQRAHAVPPELLTADDRAALSAAASHAGEASSSGEEH